MKRSSTLHDSNCIDAKEAKVLETSVVSNDCRADDLCDSNIKLSKPHTSNQQLLTALLMSAVISVMTPQGAFAATAGAASPLASAFVAYGHYLGMFGMVACLVTERILLEKAPYDITPQEEDQLSITDAVYGVFGLLVFGTGYSRAVGNFAKGFDYYSHEPVFWLKVAFVGVVGAASFFNTTIIVQRAVAKRNAESGDGPASDVVPMSEALAARMRQICNAQLTGIAFIPLTASLMARGVGYNDAIPWQVEAGLALLITLGLSYKYVKEALTFDQKV